MSAHSGLLLFAIPPLLLCGDGLDTERFRVEFLQEGVPVPMENEEVRLARKTFVIRVSLLDGQEGVTVNASLGRRYFDLGKDGAIPDYPYLGEKTMVEPNFNSEHQLPVDSELVCYWFYDGAQAWHRFDPDVVVEEDRIIATKTIDTLYLLGSKRSVPVSEASDTLFLFFLAQNEVPRGTVPKELARARAMVTWQ